MTSENLPNSRIFILSLYICGFFLMWEWLRPLKQLTDTANLAVFVVFLFLSLLLSYLSWHFAIRIGIKLFYVFYMLNLLYFEESFISLNWVSMIFKDVMENMAVVFQGEWTSLSDPFRSLLFFVLLALMSYLLHYWLINRKQIFVFFFMTLLYITILDTFTPYDATGAIVRTVIIGFVVMGVLTFYRILEREKLQKHGSFSKMWLIPLISIIGLSVIIGYAAPKASPIWPDPVPYITSYSQDSGDDGNGGMKKVGYGVDDTSLGGPFLGDDTMVYETETDSRQYWKVETKDVYTGKGWILADDNEDNLTFLANEEVPLPDFLSPEAKVDEREGIIRPLVDYPHIIYPLGLKTVQNDYGHHYALDVSLEKIYVMDESDFPGFGDYSVEFESPRFSVKTMMSTVNSNHPVLTEEFLERYTQLPNSLPQRVKDLAVELTKEKETWYDKAKAIETYFDRPEFQYDQTDVAVPGENEDYVDQFLFETMKGYCDNFSTSMVVMMRSVGIPTRWVKGYTEGDFRGLSDSGKRLYIITNNNAHSWVEVFFPEVGWVPFEPTKGFANNAQFSYDNITNTTTEDDLLEQPKSPEVEKPSLEEEQSKTTKTVSSWKDYWERLVTFFNKNWLFFVLGALVAIAIGYLLYRTRVRWLPYYFVFRFKRKIKDESFPAAYFTLLSQLNRYGIKRKPDQTLRDYARYVDEYFSTKEMGTLTENYERYLYKGSLEEGTWKDTKQLWENLIKMTIA